MPIPSSQDDLFQLLAEAQQHLDAGFAHLPPNPAAPLGEEAAAILQQAAEKLHDNYPYAHPLYAGQMLKPPHPIARAAYAAIAQADSLVIDPHKHGLQPYGCGCILFRDTAVGRLYKHDSPYTYFSSKELHLGEISLECSRAGASAVALWATQQLLPYTPGGEFARGLEAGRRAALELHRRLAGDPRFLAPTVPPQLDIVFWAVSASTPEGSSVLAQAIFDEAARLDLHLALAKLPVSLFPQTFWKHVPVTEGDSSVTCLRSVLMKPEHLLWLDQIWQRLDEAARQVLRVNTPIEPSRITSAP
jgi:tyrosine decarboxylase/aspartate 1-decarboxylase